MSTNTAQELKNLEDQKANFTAQLSQLDQTENELQYNALKAELDTVDAKIAAIQKDQEHVEQQVLAAQDQVTQSLETITFGGQTVSLRDLTINEPARQIVYTILSQQVTAITEKAARDAVALKASYEEQLSDMEIRIADMGGQIPQLKLELADRDSKLANAASQLEEKDAEIARLNSQVTDLRTEIAVGARGAIDVSETNIGADLGELMKQLNDLKPAIYNLHWQDDARRNRYEATLAETNEVIDFSYLDKGKYREVTEQEAEIFRAEYLAQSEASSEPVHTDDIPDLPLDVITPPQTVPFPEVPNMDPANGLDEGNTGGEVVSQAETISRAEFEALKQRVNQLEQR